VCVTHRTKPRPKSYLTAEGEKSLTTPLIDAARLEYGKTRKKVNRMAENVAREKGTLCKEKNIQWMVKKIYQVTFLHQADSTASCPYGWHQSGIYFMIL